MAVHFTLPDELHCEHTKHDAVLVYSHDRATFLTFLKLFSKENINKILYCYEAV